MITTIRLDTFTSILLTVVIKCYCTSMNLFEKSCSEIKVKHRKEANLGITTPAGNNHGEVASFFNPIWKQYLDEFQSLHSQWKGYNEERLQDLEQATEKVNKIRAKVTKLTSFIYQL